MSGHIVSVAIYQASLAMLRPLITVISLFLIALLLEGQAAFATQTAKPELLPPLEAKLDLSLEQKKNSREQLAVQYLRHGAKMHRNGNVHVAETFFNKAINLDPENPDGYYNLGALYEGRGDYELALKHYRLGLVAGPQDKELRQAVEFLEEKGDFDPVETVLERSLPAERPFQLKSDPNIDISQKSVAAPVLPVSQKVPGQGRARAKAYAGALIRTGLNIGIRFAIRSIAGGSSGGLGF